MINSKDGQPYVWKYEIPNQNKISYLHKSVYNENDKYNNYSNKKDSSFFYNK